MNKKQEKEVAGVALLIIAIAILHSLGLLSILGGQGTTIQLFTNNTKNFTIGSSVPIAVFLTTPTLGTSPWTLLPNQFGNTQVSCSQASGFINGIKSIDFYINGKLANRLYSTSPLYINVAELEYIAGSNGQGLNQNQSYYLPRPANYWNYVAPGLYAVNGGVSMDWYVFSYTPISAGTQTLYAVYNFTQCNAPDVLDIALSNATIGRASAGTTTIPSTTTITSVLPPPVNPLTLFWNLLVGLWTQILSILNLGTFSIAGNFQNFSVSTPFTATASLAIPVQWQTHNTTTLTTKFVQQTYCSPFVLNNQSQMLINPAPTPTLVMGANYTNTFTYTPASRQILVVGALCRSDNITYNFVSGNWGSWSNFVTIANTSAIAHAGINTIMPNPIAAFFAGIIAWLKSLWASL